jgi:DNA-binding NarL/FixJ family response regulator
MGEEAVGRPVRVVILSNQSLFCVGVESLLRRESALETESCALDVDQASQCLRTFRPDVIVVDKDDPVSAFAGLWMQLVGELPGARMIELSLRENTVRMQPGDRPLALEPASLIEAIERPN